MRRLDSRIESGIMTPCRKENSDDIIDNDTYRSSHVRSVNVDSTCDVQVASPD